MFVVRPAKTSQLVCLLIELLSAAPWQFMDSHEKKRQFTELASFCLLSSQRYISAVL